MHFNNQPVSQCAQLPATTSGGLGLTLNISPAAEQLAGGDYVEINREARPGSLGPGSLAAPAQPAAAPEPDATEAV